MTFQQKILAKQSKKGFTLVELVVVIAILAILAAVAIPMVTGIIQSATNSAKESDAASLNQACKNFITSVASGAITKETISKAGITYSYLTAIPAKSANQTAKNSMANALTVQQAANYNGLDDIYAAIDDFGYVNGGTGNAKIVYKGTYSGTTPSTISTTTKLSDIYGKVG